MRAWELLLGLVFLFPAGAEALTLTGTAPGNVFLGGQRVRLRVSDAAGPLTLRLQDYEGKDLPTLPSSGQELDLGVLPRGYYQLTVADGRGTVTAPIGVVPGPGRGSERLAVDAVISGLFPPERYAEGAGLLRRAGVTWARERLLLSEVWPARDVYRWEHFDAFLKAEHAQGLRVQPVFHDTPPWARTDGATKRFPDDLRDIYQFCRAAAIHYRGQVAAWEVWNEGDSPTFSADPGNEYAAYLKAAYLGFKAGDPQAQVAQVATATAPGRYSESLYRNGTPGYFDLFPYHVYADPKDFPLRARAHFELLDRYGAPKKPVLVTEAGIFLRATGKDLSLTDQRRQAEFVTKSLVMSGAAGTDRHFFFLFPHYLENGNQLGSLDSTGRAYPSYVALATALDLLGQARYQGRIAVPGVAAAEARLFRSGAQEVLVAWSEAGRAELPLPPGAQVYNCVGAAVRPGGGDPPRVKLGPAPIYIRVPRGSFRGVTPDRLERKPHRRAPGYAGRSLVVRVRPPDSSVNKQAEAYQFAGGQAVPLRVEVYNFGARTAAGTVQLTVPSGWTVEPSQFAGSFAPLGREIYTARLTPPPSGSLERLQIQAVVVPKTGEKWGRGLPQSSPAVLDVRLTTDSLTPTAERPLGLDTPDRWRVVTAVGPLRLSGRHTLGADAEGGVAFHSRFEGEGTLGGQRFFSEVEFAPPADWREYDGLSVEIASDDEDPITRVRLLLTEAGGASYFSLGGAPVSRTWRRIFFAFEELSSAGTPDANGHLDLDQIAFLRFGGLTQRREITLRARNFRLVRYRPKSRP